jgi:hypothetical protein
MREDSQNDNIDARRLAELLRIDHLHPVYHGEHGPRTLKESVRSYLTVTKDLARVKTRVTDRLRCDQAMKTAGRENQKRWATTSQQPSPWRGGSEQISFIQMGCEARKLPAAERFLSWLLLL